MEILQEKTAEVEKEARSKAVVQMAISSLSYSELEAIDHIFEELDGREGLLVASRIADRVGITRSVIVNALRKLESAGVIESRSLGMKGTCSKVLNDKFEEFDGRVEPLGASKIADRVGITISVMVNSLRKLESAGVIESRSLGMKGTYIKVLNDKFLIELDKLRSR